MSQLWYLGVFKFTDMPPADEEGHILIINSPSMSHKFKSGETIRLVLIEDDHHKYDVQIEKNLGLIANIPHFEYISVSLSNFADWLKRGLIKEIK